MANRYIRRGATLTPGQTGTASASPIYVDSDDGFIKYVPASTGTTEKTLVTVDGTQTVTGKTFTAPVLTAPVVSGAGSTTGQIYSDDKVLAATITYTSNVTAATITGFSWTVAAAGVYIFEVVLPTTMTTNGGLTVNFKLTTATLTSIRYSTYQSTAADNGTAVSTTGTTTTDATKVVDNKDAAYTHTRIYGSMVVNAGGTFAWQACQNTSAGGGDVSAILIGAFAKLTRVA